MFAVAFFFIPTAPSGLFIYFFLSSAFSRSNAYCVCKNMQCCEKLHCDSSLCRLRKKKAFSYTIFSFGRPLWNPISRFTISMVFPRVVRLNWLLNTRRYRSSVFAKGYLIVIVIIITESVKHRFVHMLCTICIHVILHTYVCYIKLQRSRLIVADEIISSPCSFKNNDKIYSHAKPYW